MHASHTYMQIFMLYIALMSAANEYSGELPTEFGDLRNLAIMDVRK